MIHMIQIVYKSLCVRMCTRTREKSLKTSVCICMCISKSVSALETICFCTGNNLFPVRKHFLGDMKTAAHPYYWVRRCC